MSNYTDEPSIDGQATETIPALMISPEAIDEVLAMAREWADARMAVSLHEGSKDVRVDDEFKRKLERLSIAEDALCKRAHRLAPSSALQHAAALVRKERDKLLPHTFFMLDNVNVQRTASDIDRLLAALAEEKADYLRHHHELCDRIDALNVEIVAARAEIKTLAAHNDRLQDTHEDVLRAALADAQRAAAAARARTDGDSA